MLRSFLLVPCLLICLACATPFPIESLEEGMTAETVRENFGEPEAIPTTEPEGMDSSWSSVHEERNWVNTVVFSSVLLPPCILLTPMIAFGEGHPCFSWNVERKPVVLQFAEGKLASWEVLPDPRGSFWDQQSNYSQDGQSLSEWMDQNQRDFLRQQRDTAHHAKGHKHHHDDC